MKLHIGPNQLSALQVYVFDPAHDECEDLRPLGFSVRGSTFEVHDADRARYVLTEASNSADCDKDRVLRDALAALSRRVARGAKEAA